MSNVCANHSTINLTMSDVAAWVICDLGEDGYGYAL
ncbi:MAG: hypothetical protein ACFC1C_03250 [Candidatus Malihini olakiniferum]